MWLSATPHSGSERVQALPCTDATWREIDTAETVWINRVEYCSRLPEEHDDRESIAISIAAVVLKGEWKRKLSSALPALMR